LKHIQPIKHVFPSLFACFPVSQQTPRLATCGVEQAAKLLSAAAKIRISEEQIADDLASGAPQNKDGTISLVAYAAWMLKEMSRGE